MNNSKKKTFSQKMRVWHRYIGFLMVGFTVIMCVSGITLVFRKTDFLKKEVAVEKKVSPNLNAETLGEALRLRDFKVTKDEGDKIVFENGTYNRVTGVASYTSKELPAWLQKMDKFHKQTPQDTFFWVLIAYGVLLLFLAISSLFMFKSSSPVFRKGLAVAVLGAAVAFALMFFM